MLDKRHQVQAVIQSTEDLEKQMVEGMKHQMVPEITYFTRLLHQAALIEHKVKLAQLRHHKKAKLEWSLKEFDSFD